MTKVGYNLAYSNLCFELWLILHKEKFNKMLVNKEKYLNEINKIYDLNCLSWDKLKAADNMDKIMKQIDIDGVINAIKYAKEIEEYNLSTYHYIEYKNSKYFKINPSLNIHKFVEYVLKSCEVIY